MSRPDIRTYALRLAIVASTRSEDPHRKVGAVALDWDNRVRAVAYNGLVAGKVVDPEFWENREQRRKFCIHAEENLCSLITRMDDIQLVAVTHMPCSSCINMLAAHSIKTVIYGQEYETDKQAPEIAKFHGMILEQVSLE